MPASLWVRLLLCGCCLLTVPAAAEETSLREFVQKNLTRQAYGVYFGQSKVGWFIDEMKLDKLGDREVAVVTSQGLMRFSSMGDTLEMDIREMETYALDGDGLLLVAESITKEGEHETVIRAVRGEDGVTLTSVADGQTVERKVTLDKVTLREWQKLLVWLGRNPAAGAKSTFHSLSLDADDIETAEEYTLVKREQVARSGVPTTEFHLQVTSQGLQIDQVVTANGLLIRGKVGPFDLRVEEENVAKKLDAAVLDDLSVIKVEKDIGDPTLVDELTLELSGLAEYPLIPSHRQQIVASEPEKDRWVVKLLRDFHHGEPEELTKEDREKHLRPTPTCQSDAEEIRALAKEIIGDASEPLEQATRLEKWVYDNLRKTYGSNASTSLRILNNKAGDCTEHTLLFMALARSAGIPAREVTGLGYTNFGQPSFGWHAWAEIHDGKQWVSIDPTWDEVLVDATHIKFSTGAEDYSSVNLFGKLKVKILSHKSREK